MKYSPGFDDPSARPRLARSRSLAIAAVLLGVGALAAAFMAYLRPSLMEDLGSVMLMGAQMLGLR